MWPFCALFYLTNCLKFAARTKKLQSIKINSIDKKPNMR